MKRSAMVFVVLAALALFSQPALAESLEEGQSIKVAGANAFAGKTLTLKFNGAVAESAMLFASLELFDGEKSVLSVPKVPVGLNVRAYFADKSTGLPRFEEKMVIGSISYPPTATGYSKYALIQFDLGKSDLNSGGFEIPLNAGETAFLSQIRLSLRLERVDVNRGDVNAPPGPENFPTFLATFTVSSRQGGSPKNFVVAQDRNVTAFGYSFYPKMVFPLQDGNGWAFFSIAPTSSAESPWLSSLPQAPSQEAPGIPPSGSQDQSQQPPGGEAQTKTGSDQNKGLAASASCPVPQQQSNLELMGFGIAILLIVVILLLIGLLIREPKAKAPREHKHEAREHPQGHPQEGRGHSHEHEIREHHPEHGQAHEK